MSHFIGTIKLILDQDGDGQFVTAQSSISNQMTPELHEIVKKHVDALVEELNEGIT